MPAWLEIARTELALHIAELPGTHRNNPRILEYHATTTLKATDDETPWCSSFVNWCMNQAGVKGTNSARARSWLVWGIPLTEPQSGCVTVIKRGIGDQAHVAFYLGEDDSHIILLGGNQSDMVCMRPYRKTEVLAYRWPRVADFLDKRSEQ